VTDTSWYLCSSLYRRTDVYKFLPVVVCLPESVDDVISPVCGNCDVNLLTAAGDTAAGGTVADVGGSTIGLSTNNTRFQD